MLKKIISYLFITLASFLPFIQHVTRAQTNSWNINYRKSNPEQIIKLNNLENIVSNKLCKCKIEEMNIE